MNIAKRVTVTSTTFLPGRHGCFVYARAEYADGISRTLNCVVGKSLKAAADKVLGQPIEGKEMQAFARTNGGKFNFQKFLRKKLGMLAPDDVRP
jgi:hypothetical protein